MPIRMEDAAVYLSHHGIKGMKWGVRNGPPYPLDAATSARVKAGGSASTRGVSAPAAVALFLAPTTISFAATKITEAVRKSRLKKLSNALPFAEERESEKLDPETGLYLKDREMSLEEDMERVNPSFGKDDYFGTNCALCTTTMEMRRRGYDVHASTIFGKPDRITSDEVIDSWFEDGPSTFFERDKKDARKAGSTVSHTPKYDQYTSSVINELKSLGDGARGRLHVTWLFGSGHSVFFAVEKGHPIIIDSQSRMRYTTIPEIEEFLFATKDVGIKRLDNLTPNIKNMKKYGIFE